MGVQYRDCGESLIRSLHALQYMIEKLYSWHQTFACGEEEKKNIN